MSKTNNTPTEFEEECAFSEYLDEHGYVHYHVPQETYTKSWGIKMKNRRIGVRKGVCDHWVIVPTQLGHTILIAIEMKRLKGGVVSQEQKDFIKSVQKCEGVLAMICYGAEQAIRVIESAKKNDAEAIRDIFDKTNAIVYDIKPAKSNKKAKKSTKSEKKPENDCPF